MGQYSTALDSDIDIDDVVAHLRNFRSAPGWDDD
jgi:hypothetical protein